MKTKLSYDEWQKIEDNSRASSLFLKDKRFKFIREYLNNSLKEIEQMILNNRITNVEEQVTISDKLVKIFKTPKKVQIDELIGVYKWINKFISDLKYTIQLEKDIIEQESKGRVQIERSKENG